MMRRLIIWGLFIASLLWSQEGWINTMADSLARLELERVRPHLVHDNPYQGLIRRTLDKIEEITGFNLHFNLYIVRNDIPAAYSFLNNSIYVTTALIELMAPGEDSLPLIFILCHEASHILLRHVESVVNLELLAQRMSSNDEGNLNVLQLSYRREMEFEADKNALLLMLRMGFPLNDAIRAGQEALQRMDRIKHSSPLQAMEESHPTIIARQHQLYQIASYLTELAYDYERLSELMVSGVPYYVDSAINVYQSTLKIIPRNVSTMNNLACAYILKAIDNLQRVHSLRFNDFMFINTIPNFLNTGRRGTRGLSSSPKFYEKGMAYLDSANIVLNKILNIDGNNFYAIIHKSVLFRMRGEYSKDLEDTKKWLDSSFVWSRKALKIAKNWGGTERSYILSRTYYNIGGILYTASFKEVTLDLAKNETPVFYFKEAKRLAPHLHEAKYYLALYYEHTGDKDKANTIWKYLLNTVYNAQARAFLRERAFAIQPHISETVNGIRLGSKANEVRSKLGNPIQVLSIQRNSVAWIYEWGSVILKVISVPGVMQDTIVKAITVKKDGIYTQHGTHIKMRLDEVLKLYQTPGVLPTEELFASSVKHRSYIYPITGGGLLVLTFIMDNNTWKLSEIKLTSKSV